MTENLIIAFGLTLVCAPLAQYYIHRFSRMALLENQLEVKLTHGFISLSLCYRIVDWFRSYKSSPCEDCKKTHLPHHYLSVFTFFNPCKIRKSLSLLFMEGFLFILIFLFLERLGFNIQFIVSVFMILVFTIITVVDYRYYIIPDELNYLGVVLGVTLHSLGSLNHKFHFIQPPFDGFYSGFSQYYLWSSFQGIILGAGLLFCIAYLTTLFLGRDSMGGGDIKLTAFIGAFLGYKATLMSLALSSVLGSIFGFGSLLRSRLIEKNKGFTMIAFGPYIILATLIIMYFGENTILQWYEEFTLKWMQNYIRF